LVRNGVAEIGIKEFKSTVSAVIDRVEGGAAYVITKRGRPAAVLLPVEEVEDLLFAGAGEYVKLRRSGRVAYNEHRTIRLEDLG
jgi:prevent-host-death family protein